MKIHTEYADERKKRLNALARGKRHVVQLSRSSKMEQSSHQTKVHTRLMGVFLSATCDPAWFLDTSNNKIL
jgi:hypothetical protein